MNTVVCENCIYYCKIETSVRKRCRYNIAVDIRSLVKCPRGYNEKDIEWIDLKEKEDEKRGGVLYTRNQKMQAV